MHLDFGLFTSFYSIFTFAAIRDGYKLEFDSEPPPSLLPNNRSARERPDFVLAELARLEKMGCILRVNDRPRVVNPMSVVCKFPCSIVCYVGMNASFAVSNKWRLVMDGSRNLNPYCTKRKARLEDLSHIASTIKRFDFMVVNDHDSGYWCVKTVSLSPLLYPCELC